MYWPARCIAVPRRAASIDTSTSHFRWVSGSWGTSSTHPGTGCPYGPWNSRAFGASGLVDMKQYAVYGTGQRIDLESGEIGLHSTPAVTRSGVVIVGSPGLLHPCPIRVENASFGLSNYRLYICMCWQGKERKITCPSHCLRPRYSLEQGRA